MKTLLTFALYLLFQSTTFAFVDSLTRISNNQRSGLNRVSQISNFDPIYATNSTYRLSQSFINTFTNTNFDGIKFYFGKRNNELVLIICRAGRNGRTYKSLNNRKIDVIENSSFYLLAHNTNPEPIDFSIAQTYINNHFNTSNSTVKAYFIGKQALKDIGGTNIRIKIGTKTRQSVGRNEIINLQYLLFQRSNNNNINSNFQATFTTYFGADVSGGNYGINNDEDEILSRDYITHSLNFQNEFTRSGGSKPCPPFGCQ